MKNKKVIKFFIAITLLFLFQIFLQAQHNPGDIWLVIPPDIQPGDYFATEFYIHSGYQRIASYNIEVVYDGNSIDSDQSPTGYYAVEAGKDGFLSAVGISVKDLFIVSGFDTTGVGPGDNLHFLTFYWVALKSGFGFIEITVETITDETIENIKLPEYTIYNCLTIGSNGIPGDANQDGIVDIIDALITAKFYTYRYREKTFCLDTSLSDVKPDGIVNIVDALVIAQYYVGMIKSLPLESIPEPTVTPRPSMGIYIPDPELEYALRRLLKRPVPEEIYKCDIESITSLDLTGFHISDLTGLEHFIALENLIIKSGEINDLGPLTNLTHLNYLDIVFNNFDNISPLANLTNLNYLNAKFNNMEDISPLTNLKKLSELYLLSNNISDLSPLNNLLNLTYLELGANPISDLSQLHNLPNLTHLKLSSTNIDDFTVINNFVHLTDLDLSSNNISNLGFLTNLIYLEVLTLYSNNITDLSPLVSLTNLKDLLLNNNNISDLTPLYEMTQLRRVLLRSNPVSIEDINALREALPDTYITKF